MPKLNRCAVAILTICSAISSPTLLANINEPSGEAVDIISQVANSQAVKYYNAAEWQAEDSSLPTLAELRDQVINQQFRVLIDFNQISDPEQQSAMQAKFRKAYGVGFANAFIAITEHKGELLFTPFDRAEEIDPQLLDAPRTARLLARAGFVSSAPANSETNTLPHVAFYINVNRAISDEECTFSNSWLWKNEKGSRPFCKDANISLIYRVNLERSLQYGIVGSATPDAKIVRISLDDDSTGAGIHLNDQLGYRQFGADYVTLDAYFREWSTDAIAQDYRFAFNASNSKAQILKTFPVTNVNANFERKEVSGFELGVSGGVEVDKNGPKAKLEAKASYTQSRWLTYNTQDYRIERNAKNAQNVSFTWNRQQYATAESLLNRSTDALWVNTYPVDVNRISPLSYASFVPKMDVIYKASPTETGSTDFVIDSSVNLRPIYNGAYKHYYVFGAHQSYHGFEDTPRRRVTKSASFTVDWDHPVFTGGRPVNLQLASFNNRCIEVGEQGRLTANTCDNQRAAQSFIYDQLGRYVSASNTKLCLDGAGLDSLQVCSQNLTQRWEWREGTDELGNVYSGEVLGHDKQTGELGLYSSSSDAVSLRTITAYTDVFNVQESSPVLGFTQGTINQQSIGQESRLYVRAGAAIDALGSTPDQLIGGQGGSLTSVDLSGVTSIVATSGDFQYGGQQLVALTFNYQDGRQQTVGSTTYVSNAHEDRFDLPAAAKITQLKIWADDWLVKGVQFDLN
ncbi:hemolysin [Vibrio metoecus]|uniref:leukocidin family pore-forming toxin n=1 Tax=Vibrio metoecus TaxID=1481663 RepID=UPI0006D802F2|nr:leukocidin family pore-forming toxin [Vibrio metoecus]KQA98880.1 hemolysin [Vibrio metoecus]PAR59104.1 hemolysin [Vibrio metoecus]